MKKLLALLLTLALVTSFAACANSGANEPATDGTTEATGEATNEPTTGNEEVTVMSYDEYMAAAVGAKVTIEAYVQANQSWWEKDGQGVVTVYAQDADGAYFMYEMACSEEDAAKLVPGTKIRVTGYKGEWDGEIEIVNCSFEFVEGADPFVAEPVDVTALMGTEELQAKMNQLVTVKGMTFKSLSYKEDAWDKDIYVTLALGDAEYTFCVENYLTNPDTDLYKAVEALTEGDKIDVTGFLYWYQGPNTHITAIEKAA